MLRRLSSHSAHSARFHFSNRFLEVTIFQTKDAKKQNTPGAVLLFRIIQLPYNMSCVRGKIRIYASSPASFRSCSLFAPFTAERTVTVVSVNVMSLLFSNIPFITLAAIGAHEPFSIMPMVRFW